MAKSRHKSGAGARGQYKRKKMGKGYSTIHKPQYLVRVPRTKKEDPEAQATAAKGTSKGTSKGTAKS